MDATNETTPVTEEAVDLTGTKDGDTAADHDEPYRFGRRPTVLAPYPFSERQYARLLILRGRIQAVDSLQDQAAA